MTTLGGFSKRIRLTVDHDKIGEDLTYFPITVHLNSTQGEEVFAELGSDANKLKIAFTTFNGYTQLYAEIERFSYADKKACYHISRTGYVIKSASDEVIYMYYDANAAPNTTYVGITGWSAAENVWNSNFKMVQHFNSLPPSTAPDSTSNDADAIPQGSMTSADLVDGLGSAEAHDLDGVDDYYTRGTTAILNGLADFTIEAIVNCKVTDGEHFIWSEETSAGKMLYLRIFETKVDGGINDTYYHQVTSTGDIGGVLNKECVAFSNHSVDGLKVFIAGLIEGINTDTVVSTGTIIRAGIADQLRSTTPGSNIIIGELRLSSVCRSRYWLLAANHALKDTLLTYGDEENLGNAIFFSLNF